MKTVDHSGMLTIQSLHRSYLQKEITPEAVVQAIITKANEDKMMNIWIELPTMERVKPYLDGLLMMDPLTSPLWGIPFAMKDNIDLAGVPTTAGCPEFAFTPSEHATLVSRLIAAGAIPMGKTNLDQFATGLVGTRSPFGETHNALQKELISGGSSSGSSVAVARGHVAFALGTDTAGSGRVPAGLNGLVGYKPSLGAWPTKGVVPACASLDCVTVFTHSLEDALIVDGIVRGQDDSDPWSRSIPVPNPRLPLKICLPIEPLDFFGPFAAEYSLAWEAAVTRVNQLHLPIEYINSDLFAAAAELLYKGPYIAERWASLGSFVEAHPNAVFPVTEKVLRTGTNVEYDAASVFQAMHKLQAYKLSARKLLEQAVLVMPTSGGTWTREQVRLDPISTNSDMGKYTNHCNLLDLCAVAIPSDAAAPNLPFGITWFALAENEALICAAADAFIKQTGGSSL
jgi:allophanate hydrolase